MAKKILIIDDDPDLVDTFSIILTGAGYAVVSANGGQPGIALAAQERPDLIVLDVMMSTVNEGIETAQALRADAALGKIPILMLSAVDQHFNFGFKGHAGTEFLPVDRFLEKPVDPKALIAAVREMVG